MQEALGMVETKGLVAMIEAADAIEKLINVREAAGYLNEDARCQACGYLHETRLTCPTGERNVVDNHAKASVNGAGKIALTRDELVELLSQAAQLGKI